MTSKDVPGAQRVYRPMSYISLQVVRRTPLSPHDALKHHFSSLKNGLISGVLVVLEFSWNCLKNSSIFFHLLPTSSHFHPLQVENCVSNSRLLVDEDDNGKLRLETVKLTHVSQMKLDTDYCEI